MQYFHKKFNSKETVVFRKWGRKNYSLFAVLGKRLKISVLSVAYLVSVPVATVASEPDTTGIRMQFDLEEVEVSASRVPVLYSQVARVLSVIDRAEIERSPAASVHDLLEYVAGVDIRQRGAEGVQADISIRGGSFDQTLILLNGINITDPQTGHHNLNLPISLSQVERIEILEGPAARVYGPNAFSGAINIITREPKENAASAMAEAGSFGYFNTSLSGSFTTGKTGHLLAGHYKRSDGYIGNTDFTEAGLFYAGDLNSRAGKLSVQAGISDKGFGANSFYTPVYPNQYEQVSTLFTSVKFATRTRFNLTPAVYWRSHNDEFKLFRDNPPAWYSNHNYHHTDVLGANLNSWFRWAGGKTSLGGAFRSENILSNVLGEPLDEPVGIPNREGFYTRAKGRSTVSFFLEHVVQAGRWFINAGVMGNHISDYSRGMNFFPGVDAGYQLSPAVKLVASVNSSLRMPTFTDLYYAGPVNEGNPDLEPETAVTGEGGIKISTPYLKGRAIYFHREGTNLIDWVKEPSDEKWRPMNHTQITSRGADVNIAWFPSAHVHRVLPDKIEVGYLFNSQSKGESQLLSNYVLDNLRHKIVASVTKNITGKLSVDVRVIYQDRDGGFSRYENGSYAVEAPYEPFWLTDVKGLYRIGRFQTYVTVNNVLNREYFDLGNVVQPGRWVKAGVQYQFNF